MHVQFVFWNLKHTSIIIMAARELFRFSAIRKEQINIRASLKNCQRCQLSQLSYFRLLFGGKQDHESAFPGPVDKVVRGLSWFSHYLDRFARLIPLVPRYCYKSALSWNLLSRSCCKLSTDVRYHLGSPTFRLQKEVSRLFGSF